MLPVYTIPVNFSPIAFFFFFFLNNGNINFEEPHPHVLVNLFSLLTVCYISFSLYVCAMWILCWACPLSYHK